MKKIILTIIAILLPLMASAINITQDGISYYLDSSTKTATVVPGSYSGSIYIYRQVTYGGVTYTVTSIGKEAFYNSDITYVTIPNTVTSIGKRSFGGCTNLTSITIPSSVTEIGSAAFYGCSKLVNIELPSELKVIDENLFWGCTSLTSVTIPKGVTQIAEEAFRECLALSFVIIPNSVTQIGDKAFEDCSSLKNVISEIQTPFAIPDNVFNGIPSDATFAVPDGTKAIYKATAGWNKYQNIVEVEKQRTIHVATAGTLSDLISEGEKIYLEELTLTGNLNGTDIACIRRMAGAPVNYDRDRGGAYKEAEKGQVYGKLAVLDISSATIVSGGDCYYKLWVDIDLCNDYNVRSDASTSNNVISSYMFMDCKLSKVFLPNNVTSIGWSAFEGCSGLTSVTIPNSVTSIGGGAFSGCSGLTSVTIPNSVTSIGDGAFSGCSNLTSVTIPNSVTSIGRSAFEGCSGLTSVTIPNSVTSIGSDAFLGCSGLTSITIPNSVTLIGDGAFSGCSGLASVTIPKSVTSIGTQAFYGCSGLTSVTIPNSVTSTGTEVFDGTAWYNNQPDGLVYAGKVAYRYKGVMSGNTSIIIKDGTVKIADRAFSGCSNLTSVTIPNSVTSIGDGAFSGCSNLTSVTIGNSVKSIGNYAFSGCNSLASVYISDLNAWCTIMFSSGDSYSYDDSNPLSFAHHLYLSNKEITNLEIPNSVPRISSYAFSGCSNLTSVTIGNSVTSIGSYAFEGCTGLTSVTIPNSVTFISYGAFYGCSSLTSIVFLNSNPPSVVYSYTFNNVDKNKCVVWVPKGSLSAYKGANEWKDFANIFEIVEGDLNLDELVDQDDLDALVGFVMGEKPEGFYESLADLNGDDKVDAADVVKLVTILNIQDGLSMDWQAKYSNQVISSLSCTLNNDGDKAIQLTRCELYCNESLVSSANFKVTLASGGSKKCSFGELASYSTKTGFSLVWYYTYNGEDYTYRCEIAE